jgi:iron complex transport system substrate-binding protein
MTKTVEKPGFTAPGIEDITRRDFLVGGAGLLALGIAGCGGDSGNGASGETRTVDSPMGPVELPVEPQRVVPGYTTDADIALVLDLPLVGVPGARGLANQDLAGYQPEEELEDVERITTFPETNLEQIAALEPDCIIDSATDDEKRYEDFSRIAPTFNFFDALYGDSGANFRGALRSVAGAFGREDRAEEAIAEYEERAARTRERLAERWSGSKIVAAYPYQAMLVVPGADTLNNILLKEDLGMELIEFADESRGYNEISFERLDLLDDADIVFIHVEPRDDGPGRDRSQITPLERTPLWQRVPAVEKGQVFEYPAELSSASILSAHAFLDVVEESLLA